MNGAQASCRALAIVVATAACSNPHDNLRTTHLPVPCRYFCLDSRYFHKTAIQTESGKIVVGTMSGGQAPGSPIILFARNDYLASATISWSMVVGCDGQCSALASGVSEVPGKALITDDVGSLVLATYSKDMSVSVDFKVVMGGMNVIADDYLYAIPFRNGTSSRVSQAYPGTGTHGIGQEHAVDFECLVGTDVVSMRDGTVIAVNGSSSTGGLAEEFKEPGRTNFVWVWHSDGTIAEYAHFEFGSVAVGPGQHVQRGDRLAKCGNTGYSSGPHLHVEIVRPQRRDGTVIEGSVPILIEGVPGRGSRPRAGQTYQAWEYP